MPVGENESTLEQLAREKLAGKSYSTIRQELADSGMSDTEIRMLIRKVDERVLRETLQHTGTNRARQWYRSGLILAIAGLVLSILYNTGILLVNLPAMLVYAPFFTGIVVMLYGRYLQRQRPKPSDPGSGAIRRRRPYK